MAGILVNSSFEKELLVNFFKCKNVMVEGIVYYQGKNVSLESGNKQIRKVISNNVAVISRSSQLFTSLTIVDNIFMPLYMVKRRKYKEMTSRMMEHFHMQIPLKTPICDLSLFQKLQIEILRAVAGNRKLIIVSDINNQLRPDEISKLKKTYNQLMNIGYSICQIETSKHIFYDMVSQIQIIKKGMSIGYFYSQEINYAEIEYLISDEIENLQWSDYWLRKNEQKDKNNMPVLKISASRYAWSNVFFGDQNTKDGIFELGSGEIKEVNCKTETDYHRIKSLLLEEQRGLKYWLYYKGMEIASLEPYIDKLEVGVVDLEQLDLLLFENLSIIENLCYPLCERKRGFFLNKKKFKIISDYINGILPDVDVKANIKELNEEQTIQIVLSRWLFVRPQLLVLVIPAAFVKYEHDLGINRVLIELTKFGIAVLIISERYRFLHHGMLCISDETQKKDE